VVDSTYRGLRLGARCLGTNSAMNTDDSVILRAADECGLPVPAALTSTSRSSCLQDNQRSCGGGAAARVLQDHPRLRGAQRGVLRKERLRAEGDPDGGLALTPVYFRGSLHSLRAHGISGWLPTAGAGRSFQPAVCSRLLMHSQPWVVHGAGAIPQPVSGGVGGAWTLLALARGCSAGISTAAYH
jgi:hypothetical protein